MNGSPIVGSNIVHVKEHNRRAILLTFLHKGTISRIQLAEQTRLSNTTITNLTAELMEQGIITTVEENGHVPTRSPRRVGRPRLMLRLVPRARFVIGVHIGIGMFRVALTDLQADIVVNRMESFDTDRPANIVLDEIAQVVESTVTQSRVDKALILGIGVGASGLVNHETGINVHAPSLDWHNIRVRDYLTSRLNLPVCVDNNVRTMALGEAYFGLGRTVDLLAFIYGRIGVGAGLVVNGHVFRGSRAGAGEIGHTIIIPNGGARCRCSQTGCLETLVAEPVLLAEARRLATKAPDGVLAHALRTTDDKPIEAVFAASRAGDPDANALLEERMRFLGIALTNLVNVLNPELIILGGMFAQGSDLIIPRVEATIREQAFAGLGHRVRIVPTSFGWRAGVVGAASLALKTFFYEASSEAVDAR